MFRVLDGARSKVLENIILLMKDTIIGSWVHYLIIFIDTGCVVGVVSHNFIL